MNRPFARLLSLVAILTIAACAAGPQSQQPTTLPTAPSHQEVVSARRCEVPPVFIPSYGGRTPSLEEDEAAMQYLQDSATRALLCGQLRAAVIAMMAEAMVIHEAITAGRMASCTAEVWNLIQRLRSLRDVPDRTYEEMRPLDVETLEELARYAGEGTVCDEQGHTLVATSISTAATPDEQLDNQARPELRLRSCEGYPASLRRHVDCIGRTETQGYILRPAERLLSCVRLEERLRRIGPLVLQETDFRCQEGGRTQHLWFLPSGRTFIH